MTEWKYLLSEAFLTRQVLAAHFAKGCEGVIEIGGYKNPITDFLSTAFEYIIVIDPLLEPMTWTGWVTSVRHICDEFQNVDLSEYNNFGLVILGMELDHSLVEKLAELVRRSSVAVIEFPSCYTQSVMLWDSLLKLVPNKKVAVRIALDLTGNDVGDREDSWHPRYKRQMYVLR